MKVEFKKLQIVLIATALTALAACHKDEPASPPPPGADQGSEQGSPTASSPSGAADSASQPANSMSMSGDKPATTTGEDVDDTVTTTKVKSALIAESSLKAGDITVDTTKGMVKLSGTVANADQKTKAESIAKSTGGVSGVDNQLTVKK